MRALALLLVVVVAFLLVLKFYPSPEVEGAGGEGTPETPATTVPGPDEAESAADFESQFLLGDEERSTPSGGGAAAETDERRFEPTPQPERSTPAFVPSPDPAREQAPAAVAGIDEVLVGAAVLHDTPAEVARVLDARGVEGARRDLLLAFSHALAGERSQAEDLARKVDSSDVGGEERRLLDLALGESAPVPRPASARSDGPILLAMRMALIAREAVSLQAAKAHASAARDYSELLLLETGAPWEGDRELLATWGAALADAQSNHRWNPRGEWPSVEIEVQSGDHLTAIRKRYLAQYPDRIICTGLIERANRIRGYLQPGQTLRVPTEPVSVIVDISARRVLYLHGGEVVATWEVGVGRAGEETILGNFTAGQKNENPTWFQVGQDPIPFGDARNPLGTRWVGWNQDGRATHYGFHGTKEPESIGHAASDGCVRFLNHNVEELFQILPVGTPIHVRE